MSHMISGEYSQTPTPKQPKKPSTRKPPKGATKQTTSTASFWRKKK